jgi:elongator complex protein 3
VDLIADIKPSIPRYCRVNRVVRDIPSNNVVEGNRRSSLRQDVHLELQRRGATCHCVRCREIRSQQVEVGDLLSHDLIYQVGQTEEHFLSFDTPEDQLAGFLRLSLPGLGAPDTGLAELKGSAIVREVHVYGQSLAVGAEENGAAQHIGLGTRLLQRAERIARQSGYQRLAVISAVGTRHYYLMRGFVAGELYLVKNLS